MARRTVICLDTNYLILGLVAESTPARRLVSWSDQGEQFCTTSTAWYEFLCGPVNGSQVSVMRGVLQSILPFGDREAQEAARLYNRTGRRRRLRVDAMIAAAAITHQVPLATDSQADFTGFTPLGLELVS